MKGQPRNAEAEGPGVRTYICTHMQIPTEPQTDPVASSPDVGVIGTAGGEVAAHADVLRRGIDYGHRWAWRFRRYSRHDGGSQESGMIVSLFLIPHVGFPSCL